MSIKTTITELDRIKAEIARNNAQNRALRQRAKVLEEQISIYLKTKAPSGVKWGERTIVLETREKRATKSKSQKERDVVSVLEELGISEPREVYTRVLEAQKGQAVEHHKLKIKKIKKARR